MNCVTQKVFDLSTYFMLQRMAAHISSWTLWSRLCSGARSGKIFLTMILIIANPQVGDGTDGKLVHLDGLNFSRAWGLYRIADRLGGEEGERFSRFSDIIFSWFLSFDLKAETDGRHPREGKLWPCGREQLHGLSLVSKEKVVIDFYFSRFDQAGHLSTSRSGAESLRWGAHNDTSFCIPLNALLCVFGV